MLMFSLGAAGMLVELLKQPSVQAFIVATVAKLMSDLFAKIDSSKVVDKVKPHLQMVLAGLSTLVVAGQLAMTGHLADFDVQSIVEAILIYLGLRAAPSKSATDKVVAAVKDKVNSIKG